MGMKCELWDGVYFVGGGRFRYTHAVNCNIYVIKGTKEIALIDTGCGFGAQALLDSLKNHGLNPSDITLALLTHSHWDHARGTALFARLSQCSVGIHPEGVPILQEGPWAEVGRSAPPQVSFEPVKVDVLLRDGAVIDLGGRSIRVIHTPGHTHDSVCFEVRIEGRKILLSGDTVLAGGRTGVVSADTDFRIYRESVQKLAEEGFDALMPGHGIFILEEASEHIEFLARLLAGKWTDIGTHPYPPPFDSGVWFYRQHPELLSD